MSDRDGLIDESRRIRRTWRATVHSAADAEVFEPGGTHLRGSYRLRPSKSKRLPQAAPQLAEIGAAELLPLGDDDQRVGAVERVDRRRRVARCAARRRRRGAPRPSPPDRRRVTVAPRASRSAIDARRRRLAHVVGVGLEREAPDRERAAGEVGAEALHDLFDQPLLLRVVGVLDGGSTFSGRPCWSGGRTAAP